MLPAEARAAADLGGEVLAGVAGLAEGVHRAVAERAFEPLGLMGRPVRIVHDLIGWAAHETVQGALRLVPRSGGAGLAAALPPGAGPMATSTPGSLALGALNGAVGDALTERGSDLAVNMTIRSRGEELPAEPDALARALPDASSKLALFVHGLCETDEAWHLLRRLSYGAQLERELGYTALYLRYNTGLHVSENGRRLSERLDTLLSHWPVEVDELVLVGHSMGGLVARSACHYGECDGAAWTAALRHVICLGTPHMGAPLEKATNLYGWTLGRLPETRPFARIVNGRSAGIKDLRFGSCVEEDWCDCDADELLKDRCHDVPFLESATYYFVGATLARQPESPFGSVVGDLLVRFPSASGRGRRRRIPFEVDHGRHMPGLNHFDLLGHPAVYAQLREWLTPA
jgi:pimeloyl-ACP methyl ester carboxylesterase